MVESVDDFGSSLDDVARSVGRLEDEGYDLKKAYLGLDESIGRSTGGHFTEYGPSESIEEVVGSLMENLIGNTGLKFFFVPGDEIISNYDFIEEPDNYPVEVRYKLSDKTAAVSVTAKTTTALELTRNVRDDIETLLEDSGFETVNTWEQ